MKTVSPYLSAEALGLKEEHRQALIGLASDLANHRIPDDEWRFTCWSKCVCGHLMKRTGIDDRQKFGDKIWPLFTVPSRISDWRPSPTTQEEAGQAAYNFLTVGDPCWDDEAKCA
jgi:hypothetical protein